VLSIFREDGIDVRLGASVQNIEGRSGQSFRVRIQTRAGEQVVEGTDLLAALGRMPNTEDLNAAAGGIELDSRGFVIVNERLETTAAGVWALGDVNGGPQFTHASLDDYRTVAANLSGGNRSMADRVVPYTLFIDPELGRVGMTQTEARRRGRRVRVARLPAAAVPRAVTSGETRGYWKAVVDADTDQILGVAILAAEGGEVMSVAQVAMTAGLPSSALRDMIFAHPTMAEGLNDLFARLE
jgi:pyruvate/2-oxoglutarate dehydrogenase complex dihydrolipoamide dehydrogenase (E3) component